MEVKKIQEAIIKTLLYADIFSYPLTKEEIWRWLVWEEKPPPSKKDFEKILLSSQLFSYNHFFYLPGKKKLILQRKQRKLFALAKKEKAQKIVRIIKAIPTIKLIGISGALAIENTKQEDDIDLFLITKTNSLWLTRFLATLILELIKVRRRPGEVYVKDKICLNMLIDENNLIIPKEEQNLYTAHEVCQMLPIWEKDSTYQKFLLANQWVKNYLPNAISQANGKPYIIKKNFLSTILDFGLWTLDFFFLLPQFLYMKKKHTKEVISPTVIRFHPEDKSGGILKKFYERLSKIRLVLYFIDFPTLIFDFRA